jgi:hypothetical protein
MSDTSVFREFLVGLGYQIDETGYKKFTAGIANATKAVTKFATELAAVEGAVVAAVSKVASQFEDLYYASQRINSTVQNIRGFGYAISQMGGDAAGARSALEGLASFMRSNPAGDRFIGSLGVSTRDSNGALRDTSAILSDLGKRFAQMPYYIAKIRAQMLGIDERTLQALIRGTDQFADHYSDIAKRVGVDQQAAAKAGHDFMVSLRELGAYLQLLAEKYLLKAMGPVQRVIGGLEALDRATGGVSTALIALGVVLAPILLLVDPLVIAVVALAGAFAFLWDDFEKWQEGSQTVINWGEWKPQIDQAIDIIGTLAGVVQDLTAAFSGADGAAQQFAGGAGISLLKNSLVLIADLAGTAMHKLRALLLLQLGDLQGAAGEYAKSLEYEKDLLHPGASNEFVRPGQRPLSENDLQRYFGAGSSSAAVVAGAGGKIADAGKQALAYFMSQGWSKGQATGLASNLNAESGFNPNAVGDNGQAYGVAQWHPDRQRAFAAWAGHDIRQATFAEQLAFVQQELTQGAFRAVGDKLRGITDAGAAGALVSRDFERPADVLGNMSARARMAQQWFSNPAVRAPGLGNPTASISQQTNINVYSSDPKAAADETARSQHRVNADLLRNTKGALI